MIECVGCLNVVHEICYGFVNDPEDTEEWLCQRCSDPSERPAPEAYKCMLCRRVGKDDGLFVRVEGAAENEAGWAHVICARLVHPPIEIRTRPATGMAVTKKGTPCGGGFITIAPALMRSSDLCNVCSLPGGACIACPACEAAEGVELRGGPLRAFVPIDMAEQVRLDQGRIYPDICSMPESAGFAVFVVIVFYWWFVFCKLVWLLACRFQKMWLLLRKSTGPPTVTVQQMSCCCT